MQIMREHKATRLHVLLRICCSELTAGMVSGR